MTISRREFVASSAAAVALAVGQRMARAATRPVMVSVLTTLRPSGVSYVMGTLAAVDADLPGSVPRILVCDGPTDASLGHPEPWRRIFVPSRKRVRADYPDNKDPAWLAVRAAWEAGADLLFLEDDIRPLHRGAFSEMVAHEVPDGLAFTSFFARSDMRRPGVHDAGSFQMSQAVKIPHASLEWLVQGPTAEPERWRTVVGVDIAIAHLGSAKGWRFEQTQNLVEHIGLWSAAHPTERNART